MADSISTPDKKSTRKLPGLVGAFVRERREALRISQRALGNTFAPPVTTQFISNVERGVTPLPAQHLQTLARALQAEEAELLKLMEKEYATKLSARLGLSGVANVPLQLREALGLDEVGADFFTQLGAAYRAADPPAREAFRAACRNLLKWPAS